MRTSWSPLTILGGLFVLAFIIIYPVLISIYVFLPLFIGLFGWTLLQGIVNNKPLKIGAALIYFLNLEVNLSLPLTMTIFAALLYYLTLYDFVMILKKCRVCVAILSVVLIDLYYLGILMLYDALMDTGSIVINKLLWYSLLSDIVLAVM